MLTIHQQPEVQGVSVLPTVTLDPSAGWIVDKRYSCPLQDLSSSTFAKIEASAKAGCPTCIVHYDAIDQCCTPKPERHQSLYLDHRSVFSELVLDVGTVADWAYKSIEFFPTEVEFAEPHLQKLGLLDDVYEYNCSFYGRKTIFPCQKRIPPGDTRSADSLRNLRSWLNQCEQSHQCRPPGMPLLPKRVLDVSNDYVRLLETDEQRARYACLSHCWGVQGANDILRTTWANRDDLKIGISWESLSKTFQEAVTVTRQLDIRYIWIDSLCILQDDPMDWQEQSSDMANIYQNAYITLAATNSVDARGGCFTRPGFSINAAKKTPAFLQRSDGTQVPIYARVRFNHSNQQFPLLKRAWVYQERLLSPRVIHFAGDELIWECGQNLDCECGSPFPTLDFFRPSIPSRSEDLRSESPEISWYRIVEGFSCLSLTYESDAFPALSGLAKTFATALNDTYVAGLWRKRILSDLLWFRHGSSQRTHRPEFWRAPTWSWASTISDNEVRFLPISSEVAKVQEVVTAPKGSDDTGSLRSASITINSRALRTCVEIRPPLDYESQPSYHICVFEKEFSGPCYHVDKPSGDLGLLDYGLSCQIEPCAVYIVPIGSRVMDDIFGFESTPLTVHVKQEFLRCLVLISSEDTSAGYHRLGLLSIQLYEYPDAFWIKARDMTQQELNNAFEKTAEDNRRLFHAFEELPLAEFTVF